MNIKIEGNYRGSHELQIIAHTADLLASSTMREVVMGEVVSLDEPFSSGEYPNPQDRQVDVEEEAINRVMASEALSALTPKQRQVMGLHFFGGLTISEIADFLGASVSSVSDLKGAGINRMKKHFGLPYNKNTRESTDRKRAYQREWVRRKKSQAV